MGRSKIWKNVNNFQSSQPTGKIFVDLKSPFDPITDSKKNFGNISKNFFGKFELRQNLHL